MYVCVTLLYAILLYIHTEHAQVMEYIELKLYVDCIGYMVSGPGLLPPHPPTPWYPPAPAPFPGLSATTVTGIELVRATILVTVLVFGG